MKDVLIVLLARRVSCMIATHVMQQIGNVAVALNPCESASQTRLSTHP